MIVATTALLFAILLFWFGFVQSHAVAPVVLFAATAPVVAIFSSSQGPERIADHLIANIALFCAAFALGRGARAWASRSSGSD